jgi:hypothetical protein
MAKSEELKAREKRQARVSKGVWGILLITMGVLFTLHELGRIDLGLPSRHSPSLAVDGNEATRWSSAFSDPQWIMVDLGARFDVRRVKLNWERAYATAYQIQVSDDAQHWTTALDVTKGDGGVDEHDLSTSARYLRIKGTARATGWGYSLWELEVYGLPAGAAAAATTPPGLVSQGRTATASSNETLPGSPWVLYWPLALVAAGLPALIMPKDGGDQVLGFLLVAGGTLLQLRQLELISWGFKEAVPLLLIVAGAMLLVQAMRHANGNAGRPAGEPGGGLS